MKLPTIAITSPLTSEKSLTPQSEVNNHASAVERAGGRPVVLRIDQSPSCVLDESNVRGIIFSGGGDISALRYGGDENLANDGVDTQRDAFECALLRAALTRQLPILAVCRGMQLANVVLGGTLVEDLRTHLGTRYRIPHHQFRDAQRGIEGYIHDIIVAPRTKLHAIVGGNRCRVNSFHHQAICQLAPSLRVVAQAEDGIVEAVEFAGEDHAFFIGVQWHPEALPEDSTTQRLYSAFLAACGASPALGVPGCGEHGP